MLPCAPELLTREPCFMALREGLKHVVRGLGSKPHLWVSFHLKQKSEGRSVLWPELQTIEVLYRVSRGHRGPHHSPYGGSVRQQCNYGAKKWGTFPALHQNPEELFLIIAMHPLTVPQHFCAGSCLPPRFVWAPPQNPFESAAILSPPEGDTPQLSPLCWSCLPPYFVWAPPQNPLGLATISSPSERDTLSFPPLCWCCPPSCFVWGHHRTPLVQPPFRARWEAAGLTLPLHSSVRQESALIHDRLLAWILVLTKVSVSAWLLAAEKLPPEGRTSTLPLLLPPWAHAIWAHPKRQHCGFSFGSVASN